MDTFNFSFFEDKPPTGEDTPQTTPSPDAPSAPAQPEAEADPFGFAEFDPNHTQTASEVAPLSPFTQAELDSLSSHIEFNAPGDADDLPDLELASPIAPAPGFDFPAFQSNDAPTPGEVNFDFPVVASSPAVEPAIPILPSPVEAAPLRFEPSEIRASVEPAIFVTPAPVLTKPFTEPVEVEVAPFEAVLPEPEIIEVAPLEMEVEAAPLETEVEVAPLETEVEAAPLETEVEAAPLETEVEVAPLETEVEAAPLETEVAPPAPVEVATPRTSGAKAAKFLTADDPYGEVAPPRERLRVAVLGASGIGKNHARWLAKHSCDVVSFLGSTDESIELTRSHLEAHMGFEGRGFSDLTQLLNQTQPQAVCVASPSPLHYAQAMQCLEAGIHVLCEKPLVYSSARTKRENLDGARELLKAAAKRNLVLATQLQYGAATPILCRLAGVSPFEVGDFAMEIETTNSKSPRDPKELWIDLAPHSLSVAQYLGGESAEIVEETIQVAPSRSAYTSEVSARFGVRCEGGRLLMCRAIVRWFDKIVDNREPRRRFSFNGRVVQYSGVKSPDGTFIAQYVAPDGYISHYSDPVDYLIGNFVRTCWDEDALLLSAEQGVQNLDWLLSTAQKL